MPILLAIPLTCGGTFSEQINTLRPSAESVEEKDDTVDSVSEGGFDWARYVAFLGWRHIVMVLFPMSYGRSDDSVVVKEN